MNQELVQYIQQQIRTNEVRLQRFTYGPDGQTKYPQRYMFVKIKQYIDGFLKQESANKLVIIPGFRGVGKTTLMAQINSVYFRSIKNTLFLSVEDAQNLYKASIAELLSAYEQVLGFDLASATEPILIFLDEIQTDPAWAVTLKSIFEKTSKVFICCTGSSALMLQTTHNLARRAVFERMPPLCFTEFEMIKYSIYPTSGLKEHIRQAVYFSASYEEAYDRLKIFQPTVHQYWAKADRKDITKYLAYGTLPYAIMMPNETAVYDSISLLLDKIIKLDMPTLGSFDQDTLGSVKRILFAIAENDTTSLNVLEDRFKINRLTIASIFEALEKAELLIRVPAYGSNMTVAKKPNKYLFISPAIRMSFFYITGQADTFLTRQGKLLEDSVGGHLYREFILRDQGAMRYDSAQGGVDFILQIMNKKQILIEVGMGDKDKKQIANSTKKINSDYNLVFSNSVLKVDRELKTVFVPLDYYLLM